MNSEEYKKGFADGMVQGELEAMARVLDQMIKLIDEGECWA